MVFTILYENKANVTESFQCGEPLSIHTWLISIFVIIAMLITLHFICGY